MYRHLIDEFGQYTRHTLHNPETGNSLSILPEFGAIALDLQLSQTHLLDGYQTAQEVNINRWAKNTVLFPFPNRLTDGTYEWLGHTYHFPINEPTSQVALHGFGQNKPMQVSKVMAEENEAWIRCRYEDAGQNMSYPFHFAFEIAYHLSDSNGLELEMVYQNLHDTPIPVGFGWHPYFRVGDNVNDYAMHLPFCEIMAVNERMLPIGKNYPYDEFASLKKIGSTMLDNCFVLDSKPGKAEVILSGPEGRLRYWQETGPGKYNFLQVFIPPLRHCVALEPMTCSPDAFNNGNGLLKLEPGEIAKGSFGVSFVRS
jgi:aldose 1-epimerase